MTRLLDPEREWLYAPPSVSRDEVERRLGATDEPIETLGGGLSNRNVRVGDKKLLRIGADRVLLGKEASLLSRPWRSLRVPALLDRGDDWLLEEFVAHAPLDATAEHGAAVGRALAEIHAHTYPAAGFLGADLTLTQSFPGAHVRLDGFIDGYGRGKLTLAAPHLGPELTARVGALFDGAPLGDAGAADDAAVLTHGDFKARNLGWTARGLLVLDWEFAWAGTRYMDLGHLLRWQPAEPFVAAFASAYVDGGGRLFDDWQRVAEIVDLCALLSILQHPTARQTDDVVRRIRVTLDRRR